MEEYTVVYGGHYLHIAVFSVIEHQKEWKKQNVRDPNLAKEIYYLLDLFY